MLFFIEILIKKFDISVDGCDIYKAKQKDDSCILHMCVCVKKKHDLITRWPCEVYVKITTVVREDGSTCNQASVFWSIPGFVLLHNGHCPTDEYCDKKMESETCTKMAVVQFAI